MRSCSIDGCDGKHVAFGFCCKHYKRLKRNGDPLVRQKVPPGEPLDWLKANVEHDGDRCLIWPFGKHEFGYGLVTVNGKKMTASRAMCLLAHGDPPTNKHEAAHSCRNPPCCNRNHLRWATPTENAADRIEHGTAYQGEIHNWAKLSESDVRFIRDYAGPANHRELASRFNVHQSTISRIKSYKRWRHVSKAAEVA